MRTPGLSSPDPERAAEAFRRLYGRSAEVAWLAPGRVNLIGEHTDYNDGFVLPLAIGSGCLALAAGTDDDDLQVGSAQRRGDGVRRTACADLDPGKARGWSAYVEGVFWALRQRGHSVGGAQVLVDGNVPSGAGLSSSAALECSVVGAANVVFGLGIDDRELIAAARQAENDYVGAPTGGMDQLISVLGKAGHVLLCDMRDLRTEPVPFDLTSAGLALLVIDTKSPHQLVSGAYGERRASCERASALLEVPALRDVSVDELPAALDRIRARGGDDAEMLVRRARHVVTENQRVLDTVDVLKAGRFDEVGVLMTASHASMRDDFENSVERVDAAVEIANEQGALGARMTGGGFGGCVIALVPSERVDPIADAVAKHYREQDWAAPVPFVAVATDGQRAADR
jgi:galactokinase